MGRFSDDELIERLKAVFQSCGYLSGLVIDEAEELPGATVYAHRFGGLLRAYLRLHQPEMTDQFTSIVETESLD